jgi:RHS repeat-associated protein
VSRTFDPKNGRPTRIASAKAGTPLLDLSYQYDAAGNVRTIADGIDPSGTQQFRYDDLNRLTWAMSPRYAPIDLPPAGLTYNYDPVRVHVLTSTSDGRAFTYDANGNVQTDGLRTVTWDAENRVASVTMNAGGATMTLTYDGSGGRVKKQAAGRTVLYSGNLFECRNPPSCTDYVRYVFAGSMRVAQISSTAGAAYYESDHLGSTRVVTGSQATGYVTYKPFGAIAQDSTSVRYKFTGQEWDAEAGLYNYGARLYDPFLGRFLSADTAIPGNNPQALNRYSYAINNPLAYNDPTGHSFWSVLGDIWDFWYTYTGNKFFVNTAKSMVVSTAIMVGKANPIYGAVTGDWNGMARSMGELEVTLLAAAATAGASEIATTTLVGAIEYTAARASIGFGASFSKSLINGASLGGALENGAQGAEQAAILAGASSAYTWMTGSDPLTYSRNPSTIGTKLTTGDVDPTTHLPPPGWSPSVINEGADATNDIYATPIAGPFVQATSGPHDFVMGSFGKPGPDSITGFNTSGIPMPALATVPCVGPVLFQTVNWGLMMPAAALTGLAILDRGAISFVTGSFVLPKYDTWTMGVNSSWSNGL